MNGTNAEIRMLNFADSRMRFALERIGKQAEELKIFNRVILCDENAIEPEFHTRWADKLRRGVRGFGYWCWKPHLIRRELAAMPAGGILFYCDAGCHLNPRGRLISFCELRLQCGFCCGRTAWRESVGENVAFPYKPSRLTAPSALRSYLCCFCMSLLCAAR